MQLFRLNLGLLVLVVISAFGVVTARFEIRRLFQALQREESVAKQLAEEYDKLLLEQSTQGMHARIESKARQVLHMHAPLGGQIGVLNTPVLSSDRPVTGGE